MEGIPVDAVTWAEIVEAANGFGVDLRSSGGSEQSWRHLLADGWVPAFAGMTDDERAYAARPGWREAGLVEMEPQIGDARLGEELLDLGLERPSIDGIGVLTMPSPS